MVEDDAASMFAGPPQPVEIHHRGIWYSGELIGWRHESSGRVAARVRCRVDGLRHSAWMDLADLRLPDPERPPHKEPFPAAVRRARPDGGRDDDGRDDDGRDDDGDDDTRPHVLLAAMPGRPVKPAHAVRPPAALDAPGTVPRDEPPLRHEPARAHRGNRFLARLDAYFSLV